jgi:hypothetical protein
MRIRVIFVTFAFAFSLANAMRAGAQNKTIPDSASPASSPVTADYPSDRAGILIHSSDWISIRSEMPTTTRLKHALAPGLTYGAVPAEVVSDYEGLHAQVLLQQKRPILCVCHFLSLPGNPILVKLHPKKNSRELDGGKLRIGAKIEQAEKSDLIPVDVSRPEDTVWLVRPQQPLLPGEYALMLGTQNVSIFPFTIADTGNASSPPAKQ